MMNWGRQCRESQVEALDPQARQAEEQANYAAGERGQRQRDEERETGVNNQQRRRVTAHKHKGRLAQRNLAGVAGQDVQALHSDDRIGDLIGGADQVCVAPQGQSEGSQQAEAQQPKVPGPAQQRHILFIGAVEIARRS